ncbi:hypothetical protein M885DRAFT_119367 [Pelagophyceae sp. CCMP2097]|nr:hypothetical protein M885DRAFT_119367 [Pelagophyceae sp. CCMP2097]
MIKKGPLRRGSRPSMYSVFSFRVFIPSIDAIHCGVETWSQSPRSLQMTAQRSGSGERTSLSVLVGRCKTGVVKGSVRRNVNRHRGLRLVANHLWPSSRTGVSVPPKCTVPASPAAPSCRMQRCDPEAKVRPVPRRSPIAVFQTGLFGPCAPRTSSRRRSPKSQSPKEHTHKSKTNGVKNKANVEDAIWCASIADRDFFGFDL